MLALAFAAGGCTGSSDEVATDDAVKHVGLMHVGTGHVPPALEPLKARLAELGWSGGGNMSSSSQSRAGAGAGAGQGVRPSTGVDAIVAFEDKSIDAAQKATADEGSDPGRLPPSLRSLRDGLVKSLARPGGNMTGVFGPRDVVAKQLELYQLLVPRLRRC